MMMMSFYKNLEAVHSREDFVTFSLSVSKYVTKLYRLSKGFHSVVFCCLGGKCTFLRGK